MATASATRRAPSRDPVGERRPRLEVVGPPLRRRPARSHRPALVIAAALVIGSLLFVAAAEAYITQQQVRLSQVQARLATQIGQHRNLELRVAQLSNPSHVVSAAQRQGLTVPSQVTNLPPVVVTAPRSARRSSTRTKPTAPAHHGTATQASGAGGK